MFAQPFFHETLRKITVAFGTLFNDIYVRRLDEDGTEIQRIKVPINYGPKEKWLARINEDPDLKRDIAISLPRISFERTGLSYDGDRKMNRKHQNCKSKDGVSNSVQYTPVPYNITYTLSILTKNAWDADQIVEQILPFFTPSFDITINSIPELGLKDDVPIILNAVREADEYEGDYVTRRSIIWTLDFTVKAFLYGPISDSSIIRKVQVDLGIPKGEITDESISVTPREVRLTTTPDPIDAEPTDDYGYTQVTEFFQDGLKYNPISGTDEDID